jgi:hypothetical protein
MRDIFIKKAKSFHWFSIFLGAICVVIIFEGIGYKDSATTTNIISITNTTNSDIICYIHDTSSYLCVESFNCDSYDIYFNLMEGITISSTCIYILINFWFIFSKSDNYKILINLLSILNIIFMICFLISIFSKKSNSSDFCDRQFSKNLSYIWSYYCISLAQSLLWNIINKLYIYVSENKDKYQLIQQPESENLRPEGMV